MNDLGDGPAARATILVVDDVEAHRYVVGTWLRRAGYAVVEAATGGDALHAVDTEPIDLVTLDVNLPDMSGMDVCERIKGAPRTAALPILHLSGTAVGTSDRNEGLRRGADAYLVEPVESGELLATINALLRYSAARRRAVRIAGHLRQLHTTTLAMGASTSAEGLAAAAAEGASAMFEQPAVVVMTVGARSLVAGARPGTDARLTTSPPMLPHESAAAVAADGRIGAEALADTGVGFDDVDAYVGTALTDRAGAVLGALLVADDRWARTDDDGETQLIRDQLAHAICLSVENLRAFELEHRISLTLQRSLLPARTTAPPGLDIAFRYEAAAADTQVGGDFYEVAELADGGVMIAVGDVVGHSLQAAVVMAELRNGLRAYALDGHGPTAILERLDRLLRRFHHTTTATMCVAQIDAARQGAIVANAGHIAPLVIRSSGTEFVEPHGPLLGMGLRPPDPVAVDLSDHATMLLVTDGLLERRNEIIDIGLDRLVQVALSWDGNLDQLCDRVLQEAGPGAGAADDIALLAIRPNEYAGRTTPPAGVVVGSSPGEAAASAASTEEQASHRNRLQTFERTSREIARARSFVTGVLDEWGFTTHVTPFELMVSELVSNALVHGTGQILVRLSNADGSLRLEVSDEGGGDSRPHIDPRTIGGWGLQFVDQLSDGWGSEIRGDSTLVWAVRRSAAHPSTVDPPTADPPT